NHASLSEQFAGVRVEIEKTESSVCHAGTSSILPDRRYQKRSIGFPVPQIADRVASVTYSHRKAAIGSTLRARRAGQNAASAATASIRQGPAASVNGSVGPTPNNLEENARVTATAAGSPTAIPANTSKRLSCSTSRSTPAGDAPSAKRIPISL